MSQELLAACQSDLERLIPYWFSLPPAEREWKLQRWLDKLEDQPEILRGFYELLLARVALQEANSDTASEAYHFCRALMLALGSLERSLSQRQAQS